MPLNRCMPYRPLSNTTFPCLFLHQSPHRLYSQSVLAPEYFCPHRLLRKYTTLRRTGDFFSRKSTCCVESREEVYHERLSYFDRGECSQFVRLLVKLLRKHWMLISPGALASTDMWAAGERTVLFNSFSLVRTISEPPDLLCHELTVHRATGSQ